MLVSRKPSPVESNPLQCTEVAKSQPRGTQVLVRVSACGICRTDLHVIEGELPPRKLKIAAEIRIHTEVEVFPLCDANRALNSLKNDAIRGAAVLKID